MVERQNEFGQLFRQARERTGVSLRALAERVGLDASHLFRMEKGERQPSRPSALALADALGIEGDALDDWLAAAGFAPVPHLASVQRAVRGIRTRGGGRRPSPKPGRTTTEESSLVARLEAAGLGEAGIRRLLRALDEATPARGQEAARAVSRSLTRVADALETPVPTAVIPAAGGHHRLLAVHVMQRLLLHVIGEAAEAGIRKIVLVLAPGSVEPLYRPIKEALDLMVVPSLEHCSCEQARPEGLGDAVLQAEALVGRGPFAVLLPDDVLREPGPRKTHATEFHRMMEAIAQLEEGQVVAVHHVPKSKMPHCGVARLAAKEVMPRIFPIEELIEKPDPSHPICRGERAYGIVGRYLLQPAIFKALRALKKKGLRPLHITAALEHLRREGQGVYAFKVEARREDIGEALDQAGELLRDHMTG